eukprot:1325486-Lingulodinium_polyedra.AAC.1
MQREEPIASACSLTTPLFGRPWGPMRPGATRCLSTCPPPRPGCDDLGRRAGFGAGAGGPC